MKCTRCNEDTAIHCTLCEKSICYDCAKHSDVHDTPICEECKAKEIEMTLHVLSSQFDV